MSNVVPFIRKHEWPKLEEKMDTNSDTYCRLITQEKEEEVNRYRLKIMAARLQIVEKELGKAEKAITNSVAELKKAQNMYTLVYGESSPAFTDMIKALEGQLEVWR